VLKKLSRRDITIIATSSASLWQVDEIVRSVNPEVELSQWDALPEKIG
jgi:hypothetical protein